MIPSPRTAPPSTNNPYHTGERPIITYCRIGERSSHSWFALKYLLGYGPIKNYDGSWTEWGNLVGAEIETGEPRPVSVAASPA